MSQLDSLCLFEQFSPVEITRAGAVDALSIVNQNTAAMSQGTTRSLLVSGTVRDSSYVPRTDSSPNVWRSQKVRTPNEIKKEQENRVVEKKEADEQINFQQGSQLIKSSGIYRTSLQQLTKIQELPPFVPRRVRDYFPHFSERRPKNPPKISETH